MIFNVFEDVIGYFFECLCNISLYVNLKTMGGVISTQKILRVLKLLEFMTHFDPCQYLENVYFCMVIFKVVIIAFLFSRFSTFVGPILHKISVLSILAL